jgi:anti-sigma regulatory factor (Ser/Thr protein kinase)
MAGEARRERVIGNQLSELADVERWLADLVVEWGLSDQTAFALDLVLNEAVTNVITHGYPDGRPDSITIALTDAADALVLEIEDHARPFDPLTAPAMATGTDLAHATIGGRGIRLIKTYSDEQCYSYVSGANRLKLVVRKGS